MKKILVPTDFSTEAENALAYAIALAKEIHAEIRMINAFSTPVPAGDTPYTFYIGPEEIKEGKEITLERDAKRVRRKNVKVTYEAEMGNTVNIIEEEITKWKPDLVIMGIAHAGKLYAKLIGNTVTRIKKHLQCPVLVIPPEAKYTSLTKIAVATDGSERIAQKWQALRDLIELGKAEWMMLNIEPDKNIHHTETLVKDEKQDVYILRAHDVEKGIEDFITMHHVKLLAMTPHHHTVWERIISTSDTQQMLFQVTIPLLLLP